MPVDPFSFDPPTSLLGRTVGYSVRPLLSRLLGLTALRTVYRQLRAGADETFAERVLDALSIDLDVAGCGLDGIPEKGPLIVAANHPRGALDGLVLTAAIRRVRPDARLLANYLLARIPEMRAACFFVDPFAGPAAEARSLAGLRAAHVWLKRGGALIMFPAGEVANERDSAGAPIERAWSNSFGRLASATGASVVPVFLEGANSNAFYAAGTLHARLRTALLPRELLKTRGARVRIHVGRSFSAGGDAADVTRRGQAASIDAVATSTSADEVRQLGSDVRLLQSGRFDVFCTEASTIPATLQEIGRLRADTYRAAGEGTGARVDLDQFDRHYLHLFVWDREAATVVGAYRVGRSDQILDQRGLNGLYTRTLFTYERDLIDAMGPALELGRSFVRAEYQRHHQPLLLLWRGIGEFIGRHPQYRTLFGPVSISAAYAGPSQELLTGFLRQHHFDAARAAMVASLRPCAPPASSADVPSAVNEVDRLLSALEADGKGMPVLLRHYLQLGARALAFSIDPAFGNVIDALMTVDLEEVRPALLRRYLGDEAARRYVEMRGRPRLSPAA
jgi:putative hemolysin